MSSGQRKRPGEALDSTPAQKRSRLLPSRAGGTLETEPREAEVIDLTGDSPEPEVITISDDESPVSPQQPHLSRASENSPEPLERNDGEEPREDDGDWLLFEFDPPYWSDEDSQYREQNQQHSQLSRLAENSAGPLTTPDEEEPRVNDGAQPADPASPLTTEDDNSEEQDRELRQLHSQDSREAENSAELWPRDDEEESRDNDDAWTASLISPPSPEDDNTEDWEESQQYPSDSRSDENSNQGLASRLQQEPRDLEFAPPGGPISPPNWEDDNAEFPEVHGEEQRTAALNSQEQVDGSADGTGANDAPVADAAPAEHGAEEHAGTSAAEPGVVISCPICMDYYSEIMQNGRQLVTTVCGHVFCSACLPAALENTGMCPMCGVQLDPGLYFPIYL
ncbi:E3 ubiquitin-protein ligase CIP8-like isoform X2 [Cyanistes caeruleus]|uniref:E3 ubiquitin-protein ligase CIP8-like isoform X2 n=1 Tax=Cyanistes caeruleus TaxID=156563 RepID=UPI000CDB6AFD|nr:E3 ubiquitin-protein ligase CIP8-like isoform X2 [Cyanistes caeruleus]